MPDRINDRLYWITHKGKRILFNDFTGLSADDLTNQVRQNEQDAVRAGKMEGGSLRVLTDVTNSLIFPAAADALKQLAESTKPYVTASAVLGVEGLRKTLLEIISKFSGRDIKNFDSREEALDWLVERVNS